MSRRRNRPVWALLAGILFSTALLGLMSPAESPAETDPKKIVESAYAQIREIEGDFVQVSLIKELEQEQRASGRFFIRRPDGVRWDYVEPSRQSALILGSEMFLWQEGSTEVWPSRYDEKAYGKTPLAVLSGLDAMDKEFRVSVSSPEVLVLVPLEGGGFMKELALKIQKGDFPIRSLKVTDVYGNENTFEFLKVRVNQGLPADVFTPSSLLPQKAARPKP